MSKQFFIVVIVVLVLAAITGYFGYTKLLSQTARPQQQTTAPQSSVSPFSEGSLKNLFGQNNVTCEINYPDNSGKGTVYVAEKKVRVDASMKVNDKETATHIIQNGDFMYMWTD